MTSPQQTTSVLIITGTVGVGKTAIADEIFETLQRAAQPVALINIDEFGYVSPRSSDDPYNQAIRLKNLTAVWQNYTELGTELVIIPVVIENTYELDAYKQAIPNAHFFVIRLGASLRIVEERIKNRSLGGDEAWHLKRAVELAKIMDGARIEDAVINTDNKAISVVASEALAAWRNTWSS